MVVVGKVSMTLAMEEMKTESNVQRKLPIRLKVNGLIIEATLLVRSILFFITRINYVILIAFVLIGQTHFTSSLHTPKIEGDNSITYFVYG